MQKTLYHSIMMLCITFEIALQASAHIQDVRPEKQIGLLRQEDSILAGLMWGNWGSRPYEYLWVSKVVSVEGKRVIDLGVGLPSQYNWYHYVATRLKPAYYVGIDADGRIKNEVIHTKNYDMLHMDMSKLTFGDKEFDIAYCISTFEHIPYNIFIKTIQEAHRVLKDDGVLVLTLDEQWDKNLPLTSSSAWNDLEQSLINQGAFQNAHKSFGLPDFLELVKEYFVPVSEDMVIDHTEKMIFSHTTGAVYYHRKNRDTNILHSPECYNSCVSYAVLKKVAK